MVLAVHRPGSLQDGRCGDRSGGESCHHHRVPAAGMFDGHDPSARVRALALHAKVTPQVHAGSTGSAVHELLGHHVGSQTLPDAPGIEASVGGKGDGRAGGVEDDAPAVAPKQADPATLVSHERLKGPVVASPDHVAQHGGIESPCGHPPAGDGPVDELEGLPRHGHGLAAPGVDSADLAVGDEAAPPGLQLLDAALGEIEEAAPSAHHDDVGLRPHGRERGLSFHGWRWPRSRRRCWWRPPPGRSRCSSCSRWTTAGKSRTSTTWRKPRPGKPGLR